MSRADTREDEEGFKKFEEFLGEWSRRDFLRRTGAAVAWTGFMAGGVEFLDACANAGTSTNNTTGGTPKAGGHIVEGAISDIKTMNPVLTSDTASSEIIGMLYDPLYGSKANGEPSLLLAKELPKTSSDSLTYTVTLKDNIKWTDGSAITADDVKFTYDLMFDPKYKDVNSPRRSDLETYVQSITVKDPKTVVFQLKTVYAPFLVEQLGYGIVPKKVWGGLAAKEVNTTDLNFHPTVTSGAFKLDQYTAGQQITLSKNKDYWAGNPYLDKFVYKVVPDSVTLANQLKTGEIDFGSVDPSQLSSVQASPDVTIVNFPVAIFTFYAYQLDPAKPAAKMFGDKAVRQALLQALNRQQMADAIYFKQAVVANTSMPPVSWAYDGNAKPQFPFDKAKAESALDAAGWKKGSDGIRANGGTKLQFAMITNAGNKQRENLLVTMQAQWKDIGVDATPKLIQFPELVAQITNQRTFEMFLVGFSWGADPNQAALWHSRNTSAGGFNGAFYKNPKMDKILDDATNTLDQKKRKDLYFQMQDLLNEDQPAPVMLFNKGVYGFSKRMNGYSGGDDGIGTFTQFANKPWLRRTWVADGK